MSGPKFNNLGRSTIARIQQYGGEHHDRLPQIFWRQMVDMDSSNSGSDGIFGRDNRVQSRAEVAPFSALCSNTSV
jgi:hypothetical protein